MRKKRLTSSARIVAVVTGQRDEPNSTANPSSRTAAQTLAPPLFFGGMQRSSKIKRKQSKKKNMDIFVAARDLRSSHRGPRTIPFLILSTVGTASTLTKGERTPLGKKNGRYRTAAPPLEDTNATEAYFYRRRCRRRVAYRAWRRLAAHAGQALCKSQQFSPPRAPFSRLFDKQRAQLREPAGARLRRQPFRQRHSKRES